MLREFTVCEEIPSKRWQSEVWLQQLVKGVISSSWHQENTLKREFHTKLTITFEDTHLMVIWLTQTSEASYKLQLTSTHVCTE